MEAILVGDVQDGAARLNGLRVLRIACAERHTNVRRNMGLARARAPLIASLASQVQPNARITSIYGTWDEHVPLGSELAGATNIVVPVEGHARITTHPVAIEAVLEALRAG